MPLERPDTFRVFTFCETENCTSRSCKSGNRTQKFVIQFHNYFRASLTILRKYECHRFLPTTNFNKQFQFICVEIRNEKKYIFNFLLDIFTPGCSLPGQQ